MSAITRAVLRHWKQLPCWTLDRHISVSQVCHLAKFLLTIINNNKLGNKWYFGHVSRFHADPCKWNIRKRTYTAIRRMTHERLRGETEDHNNKAHHTLKKKTWIKMRQRTKLNPSQHLFGRSGGTQGRLDIMVKKETTAVTRIQVLFILYVTIFTELYWINQYCCGYRSSQHSRAPKYKRHTS